MHDQIMRIGQSVIQHGKYNDRIYLMKLDREDLPNIISKLLKLSDKYNYGKIFCKIPLWAETAFKQAEFIEEARIPQFYNGQTTVCFYSHFLDKNRSELSLDEKQEIAENLKLADEQKNNSNKKGADILNIYALDEASIEPLSALYQEVFPSYPFPIQDPQYILQIIKTHVDYFGICEGKTLVAASSAEKDLNGKNVEMTDFATKLSYRCHGYAGKLLAYMESAMKRKNMKCLYTIARAKSAGINIIFAKQGYLYGGTLVNNTQISGKIESMNIWYKILD